MAAITVPTLPSSEWLATPPPPKGFLPLATPAIHPLTLFFSSLYYPGKQQWKVVAQTEEGSPLTQKEVTPFLKSKVSFAVWIGCKILVQTSLLWNWRIWCGVNTLGIFCRLLQWRQLKRSASALIFKELFRTNEAKQSTRPPEVAQVYLNTPKTPKYLRAFFKILNEDQFADFCRWIALQPSEDVAQLLMLDFKKNLLLSDQEYEKLIDALVLKNSDAFACFYPIMAAYRKVENPTEFQQHTYATLRQATLKILAVSSTTEKVKTQSESGEINKVDPMAFSILFATLPNNDRAHAAECCKIWRKATQNTQHVPPIQRSVGVKLLWWVHQEQNVPLDHLSLGQIEVLFNTAHRLGVLERILTYVKGPGLDVEKWKRACECVLCYPSAKLHLARKPFLISSLLIPPPNSFVEIVHPLAVHFLEQGTDTDKKLICDAYFTEMRTTQGAKVLFLHLLNYYLDKSSESLETHFLATFQATMKAQSHLFSILDAQKRGYDSNGEQTLEQFLTQLICQDLKEELFLTTLKKLSSKPDLATLLIRHFASYICNKPT